MKTAVVLMAYGSPERLEEVPAYYADIRGGRPIASHHLEDLVDRYRRLGIERSNPLNAITEQTRASLEAELGLPVFTGMKHWTPHISEAAARALESGAELVVGLVLAPHFSHLSIAGYKEQLERALVGRAALTFVDSWHDDPGFVSVLADRIRGTDRTQRSNTGQRGAQRLLFENVHVGNYSFELPFNAITYGTNSDRILEH